MSAKASVPKMVEILSFNGLVVVNVAAWPRSG
jgi:hypothetical protein